jgi:flagellar hook-associated protein 1 FlgK
MGGLFSTLHTAAAALDIYSRALAADQANVANASIPGYAALRANIQPIEIGGASPAGGDVISFSSTGDFLADAAVRHASSNASNSQSTVSWLGSINQQFDITGSSGIGAAFQQFSTAFANAAVSPSDNSLRAQALDAASAVARAFRQTAAELDSQQQQLDSAAGATTAQINALGARVRDLNIRVVNSGGNFDPGVDASLRSALDTLATLVDISVTKNADGSVNVLAAGQLPLVTGLQWYSMNVDPAAAPGLQVTSAGGGHSPLAFSGTLGALLSARSGVFAGLLGDETGPGTLNTLAKGFASRVNTLLNSGTDASGAAGASLFQYDSAKDSNVARTLTIDPAVTPSQLALGSPAGSNAVANQLAGLTSSGNPADQIGGMTVQAFFGSVAAGVGSLLSSARDLASTDQTALTTAQTNRQQTSGVSLDQEAVSVMANQRAYEASARIVSVIDQLTETEVNLIK